MGLSLQRFALPAVVLGTAFLCGDAYGQLGVSWLQQFSLPPDTVAFAVSGAADGVYVVGGVGEGGALPGQSSSGGSDAFVRKYDLNGNELWTRQFGSLYDDAAFSVSVTAEGVYVAGYATAALPGQTNPGSGWSAFVRKYDPNGNELWTSQFGSSTGYGTQAYGVSAAADGVYVAGITYAALPGQTYLGGNSDAFVRKYDLNGNVLWTREFGSSSDDGANGVSAATDGVYVVGGTNGALPGQTQLGSGDAFLRKYDPNGNELWTSQFGSSSQDYAKGVGAASDGVYVAGSSLGALPGQSSSGSNNVFVRKYDPGGNELWTRESGQPAGGPWGMSVDAGGVLVVSGYALVSLYDPDGNAIGSSQLDPHLTVTGIDATTGPVYISGEILVINSSDTYAFLEKLVLTPVSHVSALPAIESSPNFPVQWSGTDAGGPGIANYNIYVSDNGGGFTVWLTQTTATQATFAGVSGHAYGFYSIAQDVAGNIEGPKSAPEAITQVAVKPVSHVSALPAIESSPSFLVQWSGTDAGGPGIRDYTIYASDSGGPFTAWLTQTPATQATFTGVNGHAYGFYSIAKDLAGSVENSKSAAEATTLVQYPKPVSHVSSLPGTASSPNFLVQWSGAEVGGPGLRNYNIYVSDGGAFTLWQTNTIATQAWFVGYLGHTYSFFSQATDVDGSQENLKSAAEATTQVPALMAQDVNSDGQINCADVDIVKASFGKKTGQPGFIGAADVNKDGVVNVLDLAIVTQKLIPGTTCR